MHTNIVQQTVETRQVPRKQNLQTQLLYNTIINSGASQTETFAKSAVISHD